MTTVISQTLRWGVLACVLSACSSRQRHTPASDEAPGVCARGEVTEGIDVSSWQGDVDWQSVRRAGKQFAFIRVSDGLHVDAHFATNWTASRDAGVLRGAYQYFRASRDPTTQALLFVEQVRKLEVDDLPPVLDVETLDHQSKAMLVAHIETWRKEVRARLGRDVIIYTGVNFWNGHVGSNQFADVPLWIAHYGRKCPRVPKPWTTWTFFQLSSSGKVSGVRGEVDLDWFNGNRDALLEFARGSYANVPLDGGTYWIDAGAGLQ